MFPHQSQSQLEKTLAELTDSDIKRIKTLSASKIQLWKNCPMAFFQRYIAHEKIPEHIRLTFGKSIHYYLDRFYKLNYKSPESFAKQWAWYWFRKLSGEGIQDKRTLETPEIKSYPTFRKGVHPEDLENPTEEEGRMKIGNHITFGNFVDGEQTYVIEKRKLVPHPKVNITWSYYSLGKSILEKFHRRHKDKKPPVYRELRKTPDLFGHPTVVVFDRIDQWPDGRWSIADYKTNKWPPRGSDIHRNVQFTIYSLAARKLFENEFGGEEEATYHYHLRTMKLFETHRSKNDFIYLEKLFDQVAREIDNALATGDFIPHYDYRCSSCEFSVPCDKYSPFYGGPKIVREGRIQPAKSFDDWENLEESYNPEADVVE